MNTDTDIVLDLSHHNTVSDFAALYQAGIRGIIHKATQGTGYRDPTYRGRVGPIRGSGLMHGAYHFGEGGEGVAQAKYFLDCVQPDERTLLALDFEENTQGETMTLAQARACVQTIRDETGRFPLFYSGNLIKEELGQTGDPLLVRCPLWLAQYGPQAILPATWSRWTLWQHTDRGTERAVSGGLDCNYFNGDLSGLRQLWNYPPLPATPLPATPGAGT